MAPLLGLLALPPSLSGTILIFPHNLRNPQIRRISSCPHRDLRLSCSGPGLFRPTFMTRVTLSILRPRNWVCFLTELTETGRTVPLHLLYYKPNQQLRDRRQLDAPRL
jgi:hypothetical protein